MRVLVACELSGIVRDAFIKHGHDAVSCDLLPTESDGPHIQDDVLNHLNDGWDLMIAHPPCTRLCNSGVCWLEKRNLWEEMKQACSFFNSLKSAPITKIAIENPIPHKYAVRLIGKYSQRIQPYEFNHGETKATCLWLKNLPPLMATCIVANDRKPRSHWESPGPDRWKRRSITYQGIADAMADQWG